jgi:phosphoserine phosphatase
MRLVLQAPHIQLAHLQHIHQISQQAHGVQFIQIDQHAYYLANQQELQVVRVFCQQEQIDCAYVPEAMTLQKIKLAVMDMDSTLINIECIDEIADMAGIKAQISAITERAMRGELDFKQSLRERVALLKGLPESALQDVIQQRLQANPGAQRWIDTCKQYQIKTMLVSGGFEQFAHHVQKMLGIDYSAANRLEIIDGKLTGNILGDIVDGQAKADYLRYQAGQLNVDLDATVAIGDGANDLLMMQAAGAGIAYHAKPIVQQQADFSLNVVGLDGIINLFKIS